MNNPMANLAMSLIQRNPNVVNNPRNQSLMSIIQSGDNSKGEEVARNLCATYGVTPEQAVQQARKFFGM